MPTENRILLCSHFNRANLNYIKQIGLKWHSVSWNEKIMGTTSTKNAHKNKRAWASLSIKVQYIICTLCSPFLCCYVFACHRYLLVDLFGVSFVIFEFCIISINLNISQLVKRSHKFSSDILPLMQCTNFCYCHVNNWFYLYLVRAIWQQQQQQK